jgi:hypothetical protein
MEPPSRMISREHAQRNPRQATLLSGADVVEVITIG